MMDTAQLIDVATSLGFPVCICLVLLFAIKKSAQVLLERVLDPLVTSHRSFLSRTEEQMSQQSIVLQQLADMQRDILDEIKS